jgi:hypothetical protein
MITLLLYIVMVVILCAGAVWVMGQIAPSHPAIIDRLIWVLCVLLVAIIIFQALGLVDVAVPRLR